MGELKVTFSQASQVTQRLVDRPLLALREELSVSEAESKMPLTITATNLRPQDRFANPKGYTLSVDASFCSFKVDAPKGSGVYFWEVDGVVVYVGRAKCLHNRLSSQYGTVSPRHPYAGGQIQKCRINAKINAAVVSGQRVTVRWEATPDYIATEAALLKNVLPAWNLRG